MSYYRQWRKKMGYICSQCNQEVKEGDEAVQINKQDGQGERIEVICKLCRNKKECPK